MTDDVSARTRLDEVSRGGIYRLSKLEPCLDATSRQSRFTGGWREHVVSVKPEAVSVNHATTAINDAPFFRFDCDNAYCAGIDVGPWEAATGIA